ncbi:MAG: hypothetical protein AAF199_10095, partial [Pseudomonadota bacterium]
LSPDDSLGPKRCQPTGGFHPPDSLKVFYKPIKGGPHQMSAGRPVLSLAMAFGALACPAGAQWQNTLSYYFHRLEKTTGLGPSRNSCAAVSAIEIGWFDIKKPGRERPG